MPDRVKRVRRRKRVSVYPAIEYLPIFRRRNSRERRAILLALIALALGLGILGFTYGAKIYRGWRETRLLHQAARLLQQSDFNGATAAAEKALELHPDSLLAYSILADATEKQNLIETVTWRAQIARLRPGDLESQLNLASAALRFDKLETARKALLKVAPKDRDKATYHVVAGWLAHAQGDDAGQEDHFAAAVERDPKNDLYRFNLAALQIQSKEEKKQENARQTLERLTKVPQFRVGALRALLNDAVEQDDLAAADNLAQDLQMSPQVTFSDYLLCLNFYRKLNEKKFSALLSRVKPVAARDPADLALLMDWMNNNGLADDVLKWAERLKPEATATPPVAIALAEAFASVKNWSRLRRWTRSGSWGANDYLRLAYQAYAARQTHHHDAEAESDSLWRSADQAASEYPERSLNLARLATKWNLGEEAEQLWLRLSEKAPHRGEALETLVQLYRSKNDLPNLYRTLQRLHENSPANEDVAADYARLALLLDQNTADGHRVAKNAYDRAPKNVNCAVTYAFSLYSLGRTAASVDVIHKLPADKLKDPHAAVYAATLLADDNQIDAAKEYVNAARRGSIFPEEKKLLEETVTKLQAMGSPAPSVTPTAAPSASPSATVSIPVLSLPSPTASGRATAPQTASTPAPELPLPSPP